MASEAPNAGRAGAVERPPSAQAPRDRRKPASGRVYEMAQLPSSVRGGLPQFRISGHAYSRDPGTRVVRVNERILQEGQELAPGLRLDEIVPDGVVFSFQGYRFKVHLGMADGTSGEKEPEAQSAGQGP